jgi:NAD(P)H-dependent flavin oxidoreductase YrpB (nitropropane dioxygenase family)
VDLLGELGVEVPIIAAPMAGGATTPGLVVAAAEAGGLGFLAAGYRGAADLEAGIAEVRAAGAPIAVNLFAPSAVAVDPERYRQYRDAIAAEAEAVGAERPEVPREDDDGWDDKVEVLLAETVAVVSCTFALPPPAALAALQRAGTLVLQTVTSVAEARRSAEAGVDGLVVQSAEAGGHWGTFTPDQPGPPLPLAALVAEVRAAAPASPILAAGGVADADRVAAVRQRGADAVAVGTVLLLADEAGTHPTHRAALEQLRDRGAVVTQAFTGRPARGLRNGFIERHEAEAPLGYPALHHLTTPMRRAAAAAGDPERLHLWAGTGFAEARAEPLAATFARLAARL